MAINVLQVAWLSRLAKKNVIRPGDSMVEFGPQDVLARRSDLEFYARRHCPPTELQKTLNEIYDGEKPRPITPVAFYGMFGVKRYRSLDLTDPRSDWIKDCNESFTLPERFDIATNFGTAEHVFNIAAMFKSMHDVLRPGGVALHVLPTFGDVDHGFFNIHPTAYLDLAAANNYAIDDLCYVDAWDIRNKILESDVSTDFDFDQLPIQMEHLRHRATLQRKVVEQFIENYNRPETQKFGRPHFDSIIYDYCIVALRKNGDEPFRIPVQGLYGGGIAPVSKPALISAGSLQVRLSLAMQNRIKMFLRTFIKPLIPGPLRARIRRFYRP
jgi:SAM-dependent methyltransferase